MWETSWPSDLLIVKAKPKQLGTVCTCSGTAVSYLLVVSDDFSFDDVMTEGSTEKFFHAGSCYRCT